MKIAANIISWLFLPLLMPIYAVATAMYLPSMESGFFQQNTLYWLNPNFKIVVILWFSIFSFLAPGISLLILKFSKNISTIEIDNRRERSLPITITAMFCFILGVLFLVKAPEGILPKSIYALPWGGFIAIVSAGIINRKTKISLHAIGAGMLLGFFVSYYSLQVAFHFEILVVSVLVCGLVMSARLYLGKHTLKQVLNGCLLGFVSVFASVILFTFLY
ncbi:MAG: phosphatase PAP2 family protein [Flavobacteriia bacterium]|jgi:membrane-associated phospholipid phosphatase